VSPVKYELGCYIPEDGILIVIAMKASNLTNLLFSFSTVPYAPCYPMGIDGYFSGDKLTGA
jgi:hypothetical protein